MSIRTLIAVAVLATAAHGAAQVTLRFLHADPTQTEVLERCAADFAASGTVVTVDTATGEAYAEVLAAAFIAGDAPDVIVTDLVQGPAWAALGYLDDRSERTDPTAPTAIHPPGLTATGRYGVPLRWGSVALAYRTEALTRAGISVAALANATLDRDSVDSFDTLIARLTLDADGRDALDPDFDATQVVQYGFAIGLGWGPHEVASWGWWPMAEGYAFGADSRVDDPRLIDALARLVDLWQTRGIAPTPMDVDRITALLTGAVALTPVGSWDLPSFANASIEVGFAPLPSGTAGRGGAVVTQAASVWAGTAHLKEAWAWAEYLGSPPCQHLLSASGLLFPTTAAGTEESVAANAAAGIDVRAFATPTVGWNHPLAGFPPGVDAIMSEALDAIALGLVEPAAILARAQEAITRSSPP